MTVPQNNIQSLKSSAQPSFSNPGLEGIKLTSGPAVPLMIAIRDLLELDMDLLAENAKMANDETVVQGQAGVEMAQFAQKTAEYQSASTWSQAAASAFSAAVVAFQYGTNSIVSKGSLEEMGEKEAEIKPVNELIKISKNDQALGTTNGIMVGPQPGPIDESTPERIRANQFKNGNYDNVKPGEEAANIAAIKSMLGNGDELAEFKKGLEDKLNTLEKQRNTAQMQMQAVDSKFQLAGQFGQGAGNAVAQGFQAHYTKQAGIPQAGQTLANTTQSMAAETGQRTRAQVDQYYNKVAELMQLLVRASSAYPQG